MAQRRRSGLQQWIDVGIIGIHIGRQKHSAAVGPHLMQIENDMRPPDVVYFFNGQPGFFLRQHEPVTVQVMAGIGMIRLRDGGVRSAGAQVFLITANNGIQAVRILTRHQQQNDFVQHHLHFRRPVVQQPKGQLHAHLRSADLARMDGTVDGDDHRRLLDEFFRLAGAQPQRPCQAGLPCDDLFPVLQILRTGDHRQVQRPALGGPA
ncbi:MAG: hypothetical protein BWY83_01570 [bacterium ADurb.Bin478]|nr:MAG: hypothetical protein BWY83_01570 [bacterium ADurb.Bin478]